MDASGDGSGGTYPDSGSTTLQRRAVVRDSLGVALATGTYGVGFGAVAVTSGLDVAQACALSLLVFTGASQFALVGVLAAGGSPWAGAASAWLLGTRNTLYGLRLASVLGWRGWRRAAAAHVVIDESTAMAWGRATPALARTGFLVTGIGIFVLWNLATLLGAVAGASVADPRALGLDAAVAAAFLALLWPRLDSLFTRGVAAGCAAVALGAVPLTPAGTPVLVAGGAAVLVGAWSGRSSAPRALSQAPESPTDPDEPGDRGRR